MSMKSGGCMLVACLTILIPLSAQSQESGAYSADYYQSAYRLTGSTLRSALHDIIKGHTTISYSALWTAYQTTDRKSNGRVWDMYSDIPGGTPAYEFAFGTNQCGNYAAEGDCYNREHSWPQSWFNEVSPPVSDIFHIFPTDGKVNGQRGNWPYGTVSTPTWTSTNGSKLGPCTFPGYSGTAFEPIDAYKGDFARAQMYMSVRYFSEDGAWSSSTATNKSDLKPWYANLLCLWHERDSVSGKELDRNNLIHANFQHNRNPFIDHPEFAAEIWKTGTPPSVVSVAAATSTIVVDFDRYIDSAAAVIASNFVIDGGIGLPVAVQWGVSNDVSKLQLATAGLMPGTFYQIQIRNLRSINGLSMRDTTVTFKTSGVSGLEAEGIGRPGGAILFQNYPNPFNPTTSISFGLRTLSHVTLKVFDLLGREVAVLLNEEKTAGTHSAVWNAGDFPSGAYVCRLVAGQTVEMKKMILVR